MVKWINLTLTLRRRQVVIVVCLFSSLHPSRLLQLTLPVVVVILDCVISVNAQELIEPSLELLPAEYYGQAEITEEQFTSEASSGIGRQAKKSYRWVSVGDIDPRHKYRELSNSVGRLDILMQSRKSAKKSFIYCTATLISKNLVITNNHCLPADNKNLKILKGSVLFGYFSTEDEDIAERIEIDIVPVESDKQLDYAILKLGRPPKQFSSVDLSTYRVANRGENAYILHHPLSGPQVVSYHLLHCIIANNSVVKRIVFHRCQTKGGSSGALILAESDNAVLAVHFGASSIKSTDNQAPNKATNILKIIENSSLLQKLFTSPSDNGNAADDDSNRYSSLQSVAESGRLLSSKFDSYEEMDREGCKKAKSIALTQLKKSCSNSKNGTIESSEVTSCVHTGKRVRTYIVRLDGKCTY